MISLYSRNSQRNKTLINYISDISKNTSSDNQYVMNVKSLNKWDEDHLYPSKAMKSMIIKQRVSCYLEQSALDKMKNKALIANKMVSIKQFQINKKLNDLSLLIDQEAANEKLKNTNMSQTNRFYLDTFGQRSTQESISEESNRKETSETDCNDEILFGLDNYKFQIKSKIQLEKTYHNEILAILKELNNKKEKISTLQNEQGELYMQIEEKKQKYIQCKDSVSIIEKEHFKQDNQHSIFKQIHKQHYQKLNSQMKKIEKEYLMSSNINNQRIKEINKEISELKCEIISLNEFKKENLKCLIDYYLGILAKGKDVREVGLVWVLIRLYDLNVHPNLNYFPQFLDYISVRYLIDYSDKVFLVKKLKILIDIIKINYKKANAGFETELKLNSKKAAKRLSMTYCLGEENDKLDNIYMLIENHQTENERVEMLKGEIIKEIRSQYNMINNKRQSQSFTLNFLKLSSKFESKSSLNINNSHHLLDNLSELRNYISKVETEIKAMKSSYLKYFKSKYESIKLKGLNECNKYDMMFSSLFGNHSLL